MHLQLKPSEIPCTRLVLTLLRMSMGTSAGSMVYYSGSFIGMIVAMDPTSTNVLNYDHVFIRDFIPSGIAFLLKGEYDTVCNFISHTIQLQSWEKTRDCQSPGPGLMPASFKVRTVPLDGNESAMEVLDLTLERQQLAVLRWLILLTVACIKTNAPEIAAKAVEVAERRIAKDKWPEYYDTDRARRLFQTWSIAGYLIAKQVLADPSAAKILITEQDYELVNAFSCMISAIHEENGVQRGQIKVT